MAYNRYSLNTRYAGKIDFEPDLVKIMKMIDKRGLLTSFITKILQPSNELLTKKDISFLIGYDGTFQIQLDDIMGTLIRSNAIIKYNTAYKKTSQFIDWMGKYYDKIKKELEDDDGDLGIDSLDY